MGGSSKKSGQRIKLSQSKLSEWITSNRAKISTARAKEELVGYAIAIQEFRNKKEKKDIISWVTQLVVHQGFRRQGISKELLFSFWGFSTYYAWGVMSSNPYTIRSLEKMTRRRVSLTEVEKKQSELISFGKENVSYLNENTNFVINSQVTKVNTEFPANLSKIKNKLANVSTCIPWELGEITEGWEWFAFTFNAQEKIKLSKEEIDKMLDTSDEIAHQAYSRMLMDSDNHLWAAHTITEIDFLEKACKLTKNKKIVDFGCGMGRHTIELSKRNYNVIGIDNSDVLLEKAQIQIEDKIFIKGDCRKISLSEKCDIALCLYDVIGSYTDNSQNINILSNIYRNLKNDGYILISVMNNELTRHLAKNIFSFEKNPNMLLELTASSTMETTGNVFNPDYYMVDEDSNIVYRREQFDSGNELQKELIVRDYRYSKKQIEEHCINVGFTVIMSKYVQAGRWELGLDSIDQKAKEILLLCKKLTKRSS